VTAGVSESLTGSRRPSRRRHHLEPSSGHDLTLGEIVVAVRWRTVDAELGEAGLW
jgi:hypothetical protein